MNYYKKKMKGEERVEKVKRNKRDIKVRMGGDIRTLTPEDFDKLKDQAPTTGEKFLLSLMLNTGMRYIEIQRYIESTKDIKTIKSIKDIKSGWFNEKRKMITLPSNATKTFTTRNVLLTPQFTVLLKSELERENPEIPIISYQTLDNRLKKWAIKADIEKRNIIAVKTFRKTWESWLVTANKSALLILPSMGHTSTTALNFYLSSGFTPEEKAEMIVRTEGWGE